jgi:phosphate-selective porin OprO/OprP
MARQYTRILLLVICLDLSVSGGQDALSAADPNKTDLPHIEFGRQGLDIRSQDGNFHAHAGLRAQLRFTDVTEKDARIGHSPEVKQGQFNLNRARFKLGGHAYRPWMTYYFEHDFPGHRTLDLRLTAQAHNAFRFRVGQWKVPYNRERIDSSGKQQFAERSIVNDHFTLDRQQGALAYGRLWESSPADSWYNLGVFSATGRGGSGTVDRPLWMGRWQWNFLGRDLAFSQSDIKLREQVAGSIALSGATYQGPYTTFSSDGGGQLNGFTTGDHDRYDVSQCLFETALHYQGFSWQQELHWKRVKDTDTGILKELTGFYCQAGLFPHTLIAEIPRPLELALRFAVVDPDRNQTHDRQTEYTLGCNWFFNGHRNKLTLDLSQLQDQADPAGHGRVNRLRLQWDISI